MRDPYAGEDEYFYYATDNPLKVKLFAADRIIEIADNYRDEQVEEDYLDINDYYSDCTYTIKEITKEEYEDNL